MIHSAQRPTLVKGMKPAYQFLQANGILWMSLVPSLSIPALRTSGAPSLDEMRLPEWDKIIIHARN
jgi:hypothetical protein